MSISEREAFELKHPVPECLQWNKLSLYMVADGWEPAYAYRAECAVYNAIWEGWQSRAEVAK